MYIFIAMKQKTNTSRRDFLKVAVTVPVGLAVATPLIRAQAAESEPAKTELPPLPSRQLGKDGPHVSMVALGGMMSALSPQYLDIAWSLGMRYFDTADCYLNRKSETFVAQWLAKHPERRKEIFLVSKDHPRKGPEQLLEMIDKRLAACGTSYLDLFFIHGIGTNDYGQESLEWPKSDRLRKVAEKLKESGKVKRVGFACHDARLSEYLNAAAEGGFVDVIMLAYTPFYKRGEAFDKALDACHKAGIGLVAMKTMRNSGDLPKRMPEFDKLGLTLHQALLHAVWSDSRISSICSMIENVGQMEANTAAARSYKGPLKMGHLDLLKETVMAHRRTLCPGCPACAEMAARTDVAFHDIARFVTYYEQDGNQEARAMYQALSPSLRDHSSIDLAGLRDRCAFKIDYPAIMRRAEHYFA